MGIKGPVAGQDLVLGYDFGTSAVKAALLAQDGTISAATTQAYPLMLPQRGWAEQDPRDWWTAMGAASRALTASVPDAAGRIAAIGLSAQMGGVVPVDNPRFAMAVVVNNPTQGSYYGGLVAGPVFHNVMEGALRLMDVPPDDIDAWLAAQAAAEAKARRGESAPGSRF